jgi:hypothetical protein
MLLTLVAPNDGSESESNLINMLDIIHGAMVFPRINTASAILC